MNPWNIIQELEANSSTLAKQEIIKANIDNARLIAGATKCLDPMVTFGVKQVPVSDTDGPGFDASAFEVLAHALIDRKSVV
jgi:hypothetical protein